MEPSFSSQRHQGSNERNILAVPPSLPRLGPLPARLLRYSTDRFPFSTVVTSALDAGSLHTIGAHTRSPRWTRQTDQSSIWHKRFYATFTEWRPLYDTFIREILGPTVGEPFIYQAIPTLRIHMPENVAVGEFHTDSDYQHPNGEITYWVTLTEASDSNSLWMEVSPGTDNYQSISACPGDVVIFDAVNTRHGNIVNTTTTTRVSFDLRCLPTTQYIESDARSINTGLRFMRGEYYSQSIVETC